MTAAERRRLHKYIARMGRMLGLSDWTIHLHDEEPDDKNHAAAISSVYGQRRANLWLAHGFLDMEPTEIRKTLVHELLHIHLDSMFSLVEQALPGSLGGPAYAVFEAAYRERNEHATDAIAEAIAPVFPLPE